MGRGILGPGVGAGAGGRGISVALDLVLEGMCMIVCRFVLLFYDWKLMLRSFLLLSIIHCNLCMVCRVLMMMHCLLMGV
jgi:hypothetical protein